MSRYSNELKESVLRRMLPPQNRSGAELGGETGIIEATLYDWRAIARKSGAVMPGGGRQQADEWDSASKFAVVLETAKRSLRNTMERKGFLSSRCMPGARLVNRPTPAARAADGEIWTQLEGRATPEQAARGGVSTQGESAGGGGGVADVCRKVSGVPSAGGRGHLTEGGERAQVLADIEAARSQGAAVKEACSIVGIGLRTYRRWKSGGEEGRSLAQRPTSAHKLSQAEREAIVAVCNEPRFASLP